MAQETEEYRLGQISDQGACDNLLSFLQENRAKPVLLDASCVQKLSTQFLQILVSAQKQWAQNQAGFHLSAPSHAFEHDLAILGVDIGFFDLKETK